MENPSSKSIMVVAGEVSSDNHCAPIFEKLQALHPDLKIWGIGGEKMKAAGVELVYENKQLAVLGLAEGLKLLPFLARVRQELLSRIKQENTSMVMLVDYGGFNLRLASDIRSFRRDLPVLYFISPQIWATRPWRIKTIKKNTSKILVIFPFEEPLFRQNGVAARFVGHPLLKNIPRTKDLPDREKFCADHGLDAEKPLISVFTGSRRQEIRGHAPVVIQAIKEVLEMKPETQFVVSLTNETLGEILKAEISKAGLPEKTVAFVGADENYAAIAACDLVWAKSGTTTLEVAMFGKPMLIFYRGSWLSFVFVMLYKQIKNVGLPNILAGKTLVPELLQLDCRAQQLVRYTLDLLDVPGLRKEISQELLDIRDQLGKGNYVDNCIEEIVKTLQLN
ncbi:MAG: lipid-A-disaccharide synthase [Candidatus Obscuribacterales bacterium]